MRRSTWPQLAIKDTPVCARPLKPGVERRNHRFEDHLDFESQDRRGGHDCCPHEPTDTGHCGICHEKVSNGS